MGDRRELDHRLAQWWEYPVSAVTEGLDRTIAAFRQALGELSIPDHPGGECPTQDCTCMALVELVTFRAYEILGLPPEAVLADG
jgi:hypothetical protein